MKNEFSNAKSASAQTSTCTKTHGVSKLLFAILLSVVLLGGAMFLLFANHSAPVSTALAETSSTLPTTLDTAPTFTYDSSAGTITGEDKTINGYNFKDDIYTAEVGSVTLGKTTYSNAVTLKQYTPTTPTQVVVPSQIKITIDGVENTYQVVIDQTNKNNSFFANKSVVTSISFAGVGEAKVLATNCRYMFSECSKLTSLDLSNFDTSNVTDMSFMFATGIYNYDTQKLESALSSIIFGTNFDTSNVTDMCGMFSSCYSLTSAGVNTAEKTYALNFGPNFNTSNVTNMQSMFQSCSSLTSLDLSSFNTSNVTTMYYMFSGCSSLTSAGVSTAEKTYALNFGPNFNTSNVNTMERMFEGCSSLTSLDLSSFDTSKVMNMSQMFDHCSSLTSAGVNTAEKTYALNFGPNFNTSIVSRGMNSMFFNCSSLTTLDLSNFKTSNVIDMRFMFEGCSSLTNLDISSFDLTSASLCYSMFSGCTNLNVLKTPAVMADKTLNDLGLSANKYFVSTDANQTKLSSDAKIPESAILVTDAQYIPAEPTPTETGVATSLLLAVCGAVVIAVFAFAVAHVGKKKRVIKK